MLSMTVFDVCGVVRCEGGLFIIQWVNKILVSVRLQGCVVRDVSRSCACRRSWSVAYFRL